MGRSQTINCIGEGPETDNQDGTYSRRIYYAMSKEGFDAVRLTRLHDLNLEMKYTTEFLKTYLFGGQIDQSGNHSEGFDDFDVPPKSRDAAAELIQNLLEIANVGEGLEFVYYGHNIDLDALANYKIDSDQMIDLIDYYFDLFSAKR